MRELGITEVIKLAPRQTDNIIRSFRNEEAILGMTSSPQNPGPLGTLQTHGRGLTSQPPSQSGLLSGTCPQTTLSWALSGSPPPALSHPPQGGLFLREFVSFKLEGQNRLPCPVRTHPSLPSNTPAPMNLPPHTCPPHLCSSPCPPQPLSPTLSHAPLLGLSPMP